MRPFFYPWGNTLEKVVSISHAPISIHRIVPSMACADPVIRYSVTAFRHNLSRAAVSHCCAASSSETVSSLFKKVNNVSGLEVF